MAPTLHQLSRDSAQITVLTWAGFTVVSGAVGCFGWCIPFVGLLLSLLALLASAACGTMTIIAVVQWFNAKSAAHGVLKKLGVSVDTIDEQLAHPDTIELADTYLTPEWLVTSSDSDVFVMPLESVTGVAHSVDGLYVFSSKVDDVLLELSGSQRTEMKALLEDRMPAKDATSEE